MELEVKKLTKENIENNYKNYLERIEFYKNFGFDQVKARENLIKHINKTHESILEIGTGKGYLTIMLGQLFKKIVTVDIDQTDNFIARSNAAYFKVLDNIDYIISDNNKLDFQDKSFDAVVSAFTFHHMIKPFASLREMVRLTRYQLIISDFNKNGFSIIDQAHEFEGKKHKRESGDFNIIGVYLKEFGFNVKTIEDMWQKIYIAER